MVSTMVGAQTHTVVLITPQRPVDCKTQDHEVVNWVYQIRTVAESEDEARVQFLVQYGSCQQGRVSPNPIDISQASAFIMQKKILMPWQKEGVKTSIAAHSETEVLVEMKLDKKVLFKKRDENHLFLQFQPGVNFGPAQFYRDSAGMMRVFQSKLTFPWNIDVYLDGDREVVLRFM